METETVALIVVLVVLGYGYISRLLQQFNVSGPMVFMLIGILLSPLGFSVVTERLNAEAVQITAELALIIVLFSDASGLHLKKLKLEWKIPVRLLFIGLPLTIVFAAFAAKAFFPGEAVLYLLMMSLILAPTDAALGKAVVTDKKVPEKIRSSINVESGLNDGIVFPVLITAVAMIASGAESAHGSDWMTFVAKQIVFGAIIGAGIGYISARLAAISNHRNWMSESYENLIPIALALLSYFAAEYFQGNGFIAAFFAGLLVGNYSETLRDHVENFAESEGELLILVSFLVFGVVFIPATIEYWTLKALLFALLSMTVFRMVPVAISLIGTKFDLSTVLFIGWFGPRGIASILYVVIVVGQLGSIEGHETVYAVITITVLLSIILHGLSAQPFVRMYGKTHKS